MVEQRESFPQDSKPLPVLTAEQRAQLEADNGVRQFDRMMALIEEGIADRSVAFRLRVSTLGALNLEAVRGLELSAGSIRGGAITISNTDHQPPDPEAVPRLLEELCDYINERWDTSSALHLAAYVMWRLNWIHPWTDGNGRTSRIVSYMVLCVKLALVLPGDKTIPDMISADKFTYYDALDAADASWHQGVIDVSAMEALLENLLARQLLTVITAAGGFTG